MEKVLFKEEQRFNQHKKPGDEICNGENDEWRKIEKR
jgi:hypothetical protein